MSSRKITIAFLLALSTPLFAFADDARQPDLPGSEDKEIRAVVERVKVAILAGNAQALQREISQNEGLECTDTAYGYAQIKAYLKDRNSVFYKSLFDTSKFRAECGAEYSTSYPAISEKEFYAKASNGVLVESLGENWAKVIIRSPVQSHYERELYLHKEGKVWKVAGGSFVIGACSCG